MSSKIKSLVGLGVAAVAVLGLSAPVGAQPEECYPPGSPTCPEGPQTLTPNPTPLPVGAPLALTAGNFPAGSTVAFTMESVPPASFITNKFGARPTVLVNAGTEVANGSGIAVKNTTGPGPAGPWKALATTTFEGQFYSASARVDTTTDGSGPTVPETGADSGQMLQIAGIAVLVGAGLVGAASFRKRRPVGA